MKARVIGAIVIVAAVTSGIIVATRGTDATAKPPSELGKVRNATTQYHDVAKAEAAGYEKLLDCFDGPEGGMGQHYVNKGALDATLDQLAPEAMVYEVGDAGKLDLVAVEYIVPKDAWTQPAPPTLHGQTFLSNDALKLWVLHAWIWRANPNGTFVNFNPAVKACPKA